MRVGRLRKALRSLLELGKYGYCLTWGKVVEIQGAEGLEQLCCQGLEE